MNKKKKKNGGIHKKNFEKKNFFMNSNSELKCSCFKTKCSNNYCECLKSNRYCINCNCKNCLNRPPINSTNTLKIDHNKLENNKEIKKEVFCTCSKSECKLKYCECFKLGQVCTNLCKCIKCKNSKCNNTT